MIDPLAARCQQEGKYAEEKYDEVLDAGERGAGVEESEEQRRDRGDQPRTANENQRGDDPSP